jgi:hypothetical protein
MRAFSEQAGCSYSALRNWRYKLLKEARDRESTETALSPVGFVEFAVPSGPPKPPKPPRAAPARDAAEPLELMLRDGIRLRIPKVFDVDTLRRVLSAVTGAQACSRRPSAFSSAPSLRT